MTATVANAGGTTEPTQVLRGYRMVIPRVPPSLNQMLRMHWAKKSVEKIRWMEEMIPYKRPFEWAKGKVRVTITIHNARQYDRDNAYGACKPILDAMKALGLIVDDRAAYCELTVLQEKSTRKEKHTVIEVGPANGN